MHPGWDQNWRAPLREAMDWLRDTLVPIYKVQDVYFDIMRNVDPRIRDKKLQSLNDSEKWVNMFRSLGEKLSIRVE
ncbi:MAG: DUF3536 domain-containing protein [Candidatus Acidiferrales bacterium]